MGIKDKLIIVFKTKISELLYLEKIEKV